MKKTLIILLALITFWWVLTWLFFYEKSLSNNIFVNQWSDRKYAEEVSIEKQELFVWEEEDEDATREKEEEVRNIIEKKSIAVEESETADDKSKEDDSQSKNEDEKIVEEKVIKTERKKWLLHDDDSIQKFVSPNVAFYDLSYVPERLFGIDHEYIIDVKGDSQLRPEALAALYRMAEVFYSEFEVQIPLVSTYRSYNYQKWIKDRGCPDSLCAKAGHSEHQTWLAIDLWETTTNALFLSNQNYKIYFEWLQGNAHRFGYHNSYQNGLAIDGYEKEPWHWRYVGAELAWILKEQQITLTEYYQLRNPDVVR
jgi:zinc D-Ala-D-Ala carboxypeptidase